MATAEGMEKRIGLLDLSEKACLSVRDLKKLVNSTTSRVAEVETPTLQTPMQQNPLDTIRDNLLEIIEDCQATRKEFTSKIEQNL